MRLSEAIRLGAMLKPQGFNGASHTHTCALRAAADALGFADLELADRLLLNYVDLGRTYPWLYTPNVPCPMCHETLDVMGVIWDLNDTHQWTREQIADWIETFEPADHVITPARRGTGGRRGDDELRQSKTPQAWGGTAAASEEEERRSFPARCERVG